MEIAELVEQYYDDIAKCRVAVRELFLNHPAKLEEEGFTEVVMLAEALGVLKDLEEWMDSHLR